MTLSHQSFVALKDHWILRPRNVLRKNYFIRYWFLCHHSGYRRVDQEKNKKGKSKNCNCAASINILIKLSTKDTKKKDPFIKDGYPAIITINNKHNHAINVAESLSHLRPTEKTRQTFEDYFNDGLGIREAINLHQSKLELELPSSSADLASASVNPKYRTVRYWYDTWRKKNVDSRSANYILQIDNDYMFPKTINQEEIKVRPNVEPHIFLGQSKACSSTNQNSPLQLGKRNRISDNEPTATITSNSNEIGTQVWSFDFMTSKGIQTEDLEIYDEKDTEETLNSEKLTLFLKYMYKNKIQENIFVKLEPV
ncbi:uncharacterized protein LOC126743376 isoform X2 [Anthonomus grandis grandis]|uniref:uncharacterized protein LOC126743376 isoform X2 n=1 Tax=Anthonomus grandis grandis TaxID=2921223 RepID=UPI0021651431|nr:uncharacterized protein LOC126743376 isoform X2 [Anthonomus grandis grandis]XP_050306393.1 uncharacterized protein LOC126743376 isoform X2 [Anthonomus grandis grandis]